MSDTEKQAESTEQILTPEMRQMFADGLANEMGIDQNVDRPMSDDAKSWLDDALDGGDIEDTAVSEQPTEHTTDKKQWTYSREDGTEKVFDSHEDYLTYKIGADANKWQKRVAALEERLSQADEKPQQQPQQQDPRKLLFDEDVLESEEWKPVVDRVTKAFEKYHAMLTQDIEVREKKYNDAVQRLESQFGETSVRSEFGISKSKEQDILEKQPVAVREALNELPAAKRLAVLKQLVRDEVGIQPAKLPRAVTPQQAHVERSAINEEDIDREKAMEHKLMKMNEKDQLSVFGQLFKPMLQE